MTLERADCSQKFGWAEMAVERMRRREDIRCMEMLDNLKYPNGCGDKCNIRLEIQGVTRVTMISQSEINRFDK
jgi:hypothetical protein